MKVYRTELIKDSSGKATKELTLGQIETDFTKYDKVTGALKHNPGNSRTVISVNTEIKSSDPSMTKYKAAKYANGWKAASIEWKENNILELVRTYGISNATYEKEHRSNNDVLAYNSIMLDFDNHDKTLDMLKDDFRNFQGDYFIFSSINHKPESPKLRVWIPLSRTIDEKELDFFKVQMITRYPTLDTTCFDKSRFWYFTHAAEYFFEGSKGFLDVDKYIATISAEDLKDETSDDAEGGLESADSGDKTTKSGRKADYRFTPETELLLSNGTFIRVKDVTLKTRCFCPVCGKSPSRGNPDIDNAFIAQNKFGVYFIYCSSEGKTYWQNPETIDQNNLPLFWNVSLGKITQMDYIDPEENKTIYIFKNNDDFINYCMDKKLDPRVKFFLMRREAIFNPKKKAGLSENCYNLFEATKYMTKDYSSMSRISIDSITEELKSNTPVIYALMKNILGEDEYLKRFMNWNAFILQQKEKAFTAWLISTKEQGVGKDFIFNFILRPLYGEKQSQLLNGSRIGARFNSLDAHGFLRGYNEVFSDKSTATNEFRKEWLKDKITSKEHTVELKGVDAYQAKNFMNFILFSNNDKPIFLDQNDRRYNVIKNDKAKKVSELDFYRGEDELPKMVEDEIDSFADIVFTLDYSRELANKAIETAAKENLKKLSADDYDSFVEALRSGDAEYFALDEVFPASEAEKMFAGSLCRSELAKDAADNIEMKQIIPARYMNAIIKFHFHKYNYLNALRTLKERNIISRTVRDVKGVSAKAYFYEFVDENVTGVTSV